MPNSLNENRRLHTSTESPNRGTKLAALLLVTLCVSAAAWLLGGPAPAIAADIPLPPPPPGMKRIPLPPPPPGMTLRKPSSAAPAERCTTCHSQVTQGRIVHPAVEKNPCSACHKPVTGVAGKCKSRTSSKWALTKKEPELCYGCHARKDQFKNTHTSVRQGSCLSCHTPHSSNFAGRIKLPAEKVCLECHEVESLITKAVKHAPAVEGRCGECHDAHGSALPFHLKGKSPGALCMTCHDVKSPTGRGTAGPAYRLDLTKKMVHPAFKKVDCTGCHDGGHSAENLGFLKKNAVDLCYGCHERKDKMKYPHGAVILGDCATCHDPHSSDYPKLAAKATSNETCFICHQDDLTGRKAVHKPIEKGCDQCHLAHGSQHRNGLKDGEGKTGCYKCHKPVDAGKNKHAALDRYGCSGCHDSHGGPNRGLVAPSVNAACIRCHEGQKDGRHVSPLASRGHVVGGDLNDPKREGRDFSCASCHDPHASANPKLFYFGATPMDSCAWCHGDKSGENPQLKNVTSKAKRKAAVPSPTGTGGGSPGGGSPGAGSPGAGSPGAGSGGGVPSDDEPRNRTRGSREGTR